ncbi:hypothetical protein K438DRAFT_588972 [Mycena galopus ATCC 62051]|nr:hypothetical protein K438DRAFT_588972 [Mycena galopus ATCC 62051]
MHARESAEVPRRLPPAAIDNVRKAARPSPTHFAVRVSIRPCLLSSRSALRSSISHWVPWEQVDASLPSLAHLVLPRTRCAGPCHSQISSPSQVLLCTASSLCLGFFSVFFLVEIWSQGRSFDKFESPKPISLRVLLLVPFHIVFPVSSQIFFTRSF